MPLAKSRPRSWLTRCHSQHWEFHHCTAFFVWAVTQERKFSIDFFSLFMVSAKPLSKTKWISELSRTNRKELKCWSSFCVNYFLRYYLMQHQPIVKKELMEHMRKQTGLISSGQLFITAACTNTGGKMKGSPLKNRAWRRSSWTFKWKSLYKKFRRPREATCELGH